MDGGAWWATGHGVAKSQTRLSDFTFFKAFYQKSKKITQNERKYLSFISEFGLGFPGGSEVKAPACNAGDLGSIPGLGRSPGEGNGNSLQYSCLENPMDRGAWWATGHGVAKSRTRLSDFTSLSERQLSVELKHTGSVVILSWLKSWF